MTKKRFIAGALCPICHQYDTIKWWKLDHMEVNECVKCGHIERTADTSSECFDDKTKEKVIGIFKPQ